jgi:hypothetical protein
MPQISDYLPALSGQDFADYQQSWFSFLPLRFLEALD